jgi:hypothetical protein
MCWGRANLNTIFHCIREIEYYNEYLTSPQYSHTSVGPTTMWLLSMELGGGGLKCKKKRFSLGRSSTHVRLNPFQIFSIKVRSHKCSTAQRMCERSLILMSFGMLVHQRSVSDSVSWIMKHVISCRSWPYRSSRKRMIAAAATTTAKDSVNRCPDVVNELDWLHRWRLHTHVFWWSPAFHRSLERMRRPAAVVTLPDMHPFNFSSLSGKVQPLQ